MLCCVGFLIFLPASAASGVVPGVPATFASANEDGGTNAPASDGKYLLTLAEEISERVLHPVHAHLLTTLSVTVASFGVSVLLFLATNACGQGVICGRSVAEDRPWMAAHKVPSFLGVFLL